MNNTQLRGIGVRKSSNTHCYDTESVSNSDDLYRQDNVEEPSLSDCASSPMSFGKKFVKSNGVGTDDSDEYCKEVQCIEMDKSNGSRNGGNNGLLALTMNDNEDVTGQEIISNPIDRDSEASRHQNGFTYGTLEQRLNSVQRTIESLADPCYADETSSVSMGADMPSNRSLSLSRSWSCRANIVADQVEQADCSPPNGSERNFPGRPESVRRRFPLFNNGTDKPHLTRNDSSSSIDSALSVRTSADEDITSLQTFVAGMKKMANVQVRTILHFCPCKNFVVFSCLMSNVSYFNLHVLPYVRIRFRNQVIKTIILRRMLKMLVWIQCKKSWELQIGPRNLRDCREPYLNFGKFAMFH